MPLSVKTSSKPTVSTYLGQGFMASKDAGTPVLLLRLLTCHKQGWGNRTCMHERRFLFVLEASLQRPLDKSGWEPGRALARRDSQPLHPLTAQTTQSHGPQSWSHSTAPCPPKSLLHLWNCTLIMIYHLQVIINTAVLKTHLLQSLFQDFHTAFSTGFPKIEKHII